MIDPQLLDKLNDRQMAAVSAPEESALILAGAGSGKTRVLTTRIAWLLSQGLAKPHEILAVTFTNKAAKEMLQRIEALIPYDLKSMWVGTFHGLCNRILRTHAADAGLAKTFQILDSADQLSLVKRLMKEMNLDPERYDPRAFCSMINWNKENGVRASSPLLSEESKEFLQLYRNYEIACQRENVVDFAELLLRCYELLDRNEIVRNHYQDRFHHILVDEFQDTNVLQYRWLMLLAGVGRRWDGKSLNAVFAVGDDDQSIYAFRGARVGNMSDFLKDFKVDSPIRLEQNYRSTSTILDAANALISYNPDRLGKRLWTAGLKGDPITLQVFSDDVAEAKFVQSEIKRLMHKGLHYRDFAVLYRTNAQSRSIEQQLSAAGIPYRVWGGQRFFERAEVKHVLAYLRLLDNPNDDTSFLRVVNFPARGIGAKSLEQLTNIARERGSSHWRALISGLADVPVRIRAFSDLIESLRSKTAKMGLPDMIREVLKDSGLLEHYRKERDGEERIANMEEIIPAALGYLEAEGLDKDLPANTIAPERELTPLQGFLTQATLEAGDKNEGDVDTVSLMTVHAAKGLEFSTVFIVGLEDGLFPHFSAKRDQGIDEERRLMYVAITRAKLRLYLSRCESRMMHGDWRNNQASQFIDEIPSELVSVETPRERSQRMFAERTFNNFGSGYGRREGGYERRESRREPRFRIPAQPAARPADDAKEIAPRVNALRKHTDDLAAKAGFSIGERVTHKAFGEGSVTGLGGAGNQMRIKIRFKDQERELLLSIARAHLTKL